MRTIIFAVVIGLIILIYAGLNYYIGRRGWQALGRHIPSLSRKGYWTVFWAVALAYLGGRVFKNYLPDVLSAGLTVVGAYWLAAMFYFVLILAAVDLMRLLDRGLGFMGLGLIPAAVQRHPLTRPVAGLVVLALVMGIVGYGAWNARHPRVRHYNVTVAKQAGAMKNLRAVMVSDIHADTIVDNRRVKEMVAMVNRLEPDIVFLAGDMIDENVETFVEQRLVESFRRLRPRLGTYAVLGNHEYISGHAEEAVRYLEKAGVVVLRDRYVKVADSFYVAGRDDRGHGERADRPERKELPALLAGIDRSLPVILLAHQPVQLEEAARSGADLQLSGHTHVGQLFPNRLITKRIYENDWGYLRKGNLQVIVSSGFGTWGPPIRTGNTPEIVEVELHFGK